MEREAFPIAEANELICSPVASTLENAESYSIGSSGEEKLLHWFAVYIRGTDR